MEELGLGGAPKETGENPNPIPIQEKPIKPVEKKTNPKI